MDTQQSQDTQTQHKSPYQTPELADYGMIETLTKGFAPTEALNGSAAPDALN